MPASQLVVGDIIRVRSGVKVPADVRFIHTSDLKVEMSSLTGEAKPVTMSVQPQETESCVHAHNIGFSSSLVISGEGIGIVIR